MDETRKSPNEGMPTSRGTDVNGESRETSANNSSSGTRKPVEATAPSEMKKFDGVRSHAEEGLVKSKVSMKRIELIEAWINIQFQPLVFSVQNNPVIGPFMRQYVDSLRHQTRKVAGFYANISEQQENFADDNWLAAEKYVDSIGVWARSLASFNEQKFEEMFRMLKEALPPESYRRKVAELAEEMWINSNEIYPNAVHIWGAAETHMLTIGARSVSSARTMYDAIKALRQAFTDFAAETYLAAIRQQAFYIWKNRGEPSGQEMATWLEAERQMLGQET